VVDRLIGALGVIWATMNRTYYIWVKASVKVKEGRKAQDAYSKCLAYNTRLRVDEGKRPRKDDSSDQPAGYVRAYSTTERHPFFFESVYILGHTSRCRPVACTYIQTFESG